MTNATIWEMIKTIEGQ